MRFSGSDAPAEQKRMRPADAEAKAVPVDAESEAKAVPADAESEAKAVPADAEPEAKAVPADADAESEAKAVPADAESEAKASPAEPEAKAASADAEAKAASADAEAKAVPADADSEAKAVPADADSEAKAAPADTEAKAAPADAESEAKAAPADADADADADAEPEAKAVPADADSEAKAVPADAESEAKAVPADAESEAKAVPADAESEAKAVPADAESEAKAVPADAESEAKASPAEPEVKASPADAESEAKASPAEPEAKASPAEPEAKAAPADAEAKAASADAESEAKASPAEPEAKASPAEPEAKAAPADAEAKAAPADAESEAKAVPVDTPVKVHAAGPEAVHGNGASKPPAGPPEHWEALFLEDGWPYFHNIKTDEVSWLPPEGFTCPPPDAELPPGWSEFRTEDGFRYYFYERELEDGSFCTLLRDSGLARASRLGNPSGWRPADPARARDFHQLAVRLAMSATGEPAAEARPQAPGGMVGALAALGQLLSDAAFSGDTAKVDHLLREKKIPVNCKDNDGFTALHRSCVTGNVDMVNFLLNAGAMVNEKDAYGDSPLHYACFCGHKAVVALLVDRGADPMRVSADGKTPVQSAEEEGHAEVVELLKSKGAKLDAPSGATSGPAPAAPMTGPPKSVPTRRLIAGLDFSVGVVLEGELRKKRANKLQKWRRKFYVMSATYGALFFWTGSSDKVEGVIKKVRFETFFAVRHFPSKQGGKRFDIQVVTGRTMQLLADSPELALKWVSTLREYIGKSMGALRIQSAWRGHVARLKLRHVKDERSRIVATAGAAAAAGTAKEGASSTSHILIEGALKKKNSKISASLLSAFRTRYFVLDAREGALLYYKSKALRNLGEPPVRVPMVSFLAVDPIKDRKGGFTPRFHLRVTAGRVFIFEAPSSEEAVAWMTALQRAMPRDNIAAIVVQRVYRGHLVRKRAKVAKSEAAARTAALAAAYCKPEERSFDDVVAAATKIQAVVRGSRGRKHAHALALAQRRKEQARASRLYLKSGKHRSPAGKPAERSKAQESRMQRLMRLRAAKEAKQAGAAAAKAADAGSAPLPPPPSVWVKHTDPDAGRDFWFNSETGVTTWTDPALPRFGPWVEITDDEGDTFYTNETTGESQWDPPEEVLAAKAAAASREGEAAAAPAPAAPPKGLPPPWVAQKNPDDGSVFYAHQETGQSQWEKPDGFDEQFPPVGSYALWTRVEDDDGDVFFTNNRTGESQWDVPEDYVAPEASAWSKEVDPVTNKPYWFNATTGESRWTDPAASEDEAASGAGGASKPTPMASPALGAAAAGAVPPLAAAEADASEVMTFTSWVNSTIAAHPGQLLVDGAEGAAAAAVGWLESQLPLDLAAESPALFQAARNGVLIAKLANAVAAIHGGDAAVDERALETSAAPKDEEEAAAAAAAADDHELFFFANAATDPALENAQLALSAARASGAMIPSSVTARQITLGQPAAVLDVVWGLWKRSLTDTVSVRARPEAVCLIDVGSGEELADLLRLKPEELLLRWVNHQLDLADSWSSEERCTAFGPQLADSNMLSAVVRRLCKEDEHRDLLPADDEARAALDAHDLASNTIWVASRLGVPEWFSVEAVTSGNVRLQLAFVAMLWQQVEASMGPSTTPQLERRRSSSVAVRRRTMDTHNLAAVKNELATMIRDELGDADAATITRENRVQRQWINSLGIPGVAVHDLASDVRDGVVLLQVVDRIEPGLVNWKRAHAKPRNRYQHVENCNILLRVCKAMEMSIVNLSGPDIAAGNPKLVAAVVWQLMRHHTLRILSAVAFSGFDVSEAQILEWASQRLEPEHQFKTFADPSLATGISLLHLMHSVRPMVDWSLVSAGDTEEERRTNALYLLSVARKMGAAVFCTWEDIVQVKPKMVMTLLASAIVVDQKTQGGAERLARAQSEGADALADAHQDDDDELIAAAAKAAAVTDFAVDSDDDDDDEEEDGRGAAAAAAASSGAA
ncbi:hypothetical protein FNF28_05899 [Cafeteria roenbergensis]|uniref:Calmodulin n=1 Tax=Cafeteria roenbergensis TaxID=33653 RepID=A0A5A8D5Z1_CAFRO|nr:hypothetical protein FNF28_05899 [Cafeteria roenbergensis]